MKVLLINPPVRQRMLPQEIPVGLSMIAAVTKQENHQIAFLDLNAHRVQLQIAADEIAIDDYDIIGIGGLSSQYKDIKKILPICRQIHPDALIVAGGGFATYMPDKILRIRPEIDIVVIGEGEDTWRDILRVGNKGDFSKVKGISFRDNSGQIIFTEPRPLIPSMDSLPLPAYDLLDIDIYAENYNLAYSEESLFTKRKIHIITERGCPRQCTFCTHNGMSRWDQIVAVGKEKVRELDKEFGFQQIARFNSPEYTLKHMLHLHENYKMGYVYLSDENMTSNRKRTIELCNLMIEKGTPNYLHWGTAGDAASVDDDLIMLMKKAGCTFITFGGESGSDKVLKEDIQKGTTAAMNQNAVDIMKRVGMEPIMTFMLGNPNENINDILETTQFFINNNLACDPFICTPYPGTKLFLDYENEILSQFDEKLSQLNDHPKGSIDETIIKKWKDDALDKFLSSLDDADVLSAHVSQVFNHHDLLGLKALMFSHDIPRLLKVAHLRNWEHDAKWDKQCPVCESKKELSKFIEHKIIEA
jgi:anaerobic magnesium-protoporphyrin IX monomethyl ester cyclase